MQLVFVFSLKSCDTQRRCGQDAAAVTLVKIGAHAGHVTDVVANVIGDCGWVAGIVLGNAVLNLANEVGTDVGRLRKDAATHTGKERLTTRSHAKAEHCDGDLFERKRLKTECRHQPVENEKPEHDVQQPQPDNRQPHHSARTKRHLQAFIEGSLGASSCSVTGKRCRLHAKPTG